MKPDRILFLTGAVIVLVAPGLAFRPPFRSLGQGLVLSIGVLAVYLAVSLAWRKNKS